MLSRIGFIGHIWRIMTTYKDRRLGLPIQAESTDGHGWPTTDPPVALPDRRCLCSFTIVWNLDPRPIRRLRGCSPVCDWLHRVETVIPETIYQPIYSHTNLAVALMPCGHEGVEQNSLESGSETGFSSQPVQTVLTPASPALLT